MPNSKRLPFKVYPGRNRPEIFAAGSVLTIGAFDGVHLGHQRIIDELKAMAEQMHLPSAVMTFRPDPAEFFSAHAGAPLMNWREKVMALQTTGVDAVLCMPFDKTVSKLSAEQFIEELVRQLGVRFLMVGDDFQFGNGREGDFQLLTELGERLGFSVQQSQTHMLDDQRISSTWVRQCLAAGELDKAAQLLGRSYQICGRVVSGKKLGRELGFPTANIPLRRRKAALTGVFAVEVELASGVRHLGVANVGVRPVVNSLEKPLLEVHLLDFSGDLYGQEMRVNFKTKLRDEAKFASLDALKNAIQNDVQQARNWFNQAAVIA